MKFTTHLVLLYMILMFGKISFGQTNQVTNLKLTSLSSYYPDETRKWRIRNPNQAPLQVWYKVIGTTQTDTITAPVGDSFFYTQAIQGPNTTKLFWKNENGTIKSTVKASSGQENMEDFMLGANFNKSSELIDLPLVNKVGIEYVRAFIDVPVWLKNQRTEVKEILLRRFDGFDTIRKATAAPNNKKFVLGFRYFFINRKMEIPEPGTIKEQALFRLYEVVLDEIGDRIDYLVLGNEPFLETVDASQIANPGEIAPIVTFTKRLLDSVVDPFYRDKQKRPEFLVGAFNALQKTEMNTKAGVRQLMAFAETDHRISGIDLHPHAQSMEEIEGQLSFVRDSMNFTKKVIATEFSLIGYLGQNKADKLGSTPEGQSFVQKYADETGFTDDTTVGEFYVYVNSNNPPNESDMFLEMFQSRSYYIDDFMGKFIELFDTYKVSLGTYGLSQQTQPTGRGASWWAVRAFYNFTLGFDKNGNPLRNPLIDEKYFPFTDELTQSQESVPLGNALSQKIRFHPNPAGDFLISTLPKGTDILELTVTDMYGVTKTAVVQTSKTKKIDLSSLSRGIYIVQIKTGSKRETQKIIKE